MYDRSSGGCALFVVACTVLGLLPLLATVMVR